MFSVGVGFVVLGMLVDKGPNVVGIKTCSQCMSSTLAPSLTLNEKSNLNSADQFLPVAARSILLVRKA